VFNKYNFWGGVGGGIEKRIRTRFSRVVRTVLLIRRAWALRSEEGKAWIKKENKKRKSLLGVTIRGIESNGKLYIQKKGRRGVGKKERRTGGLPLGETGRNIVRTEVLGRDLGEKGEKKGARSPDQRSRSAVSIK